MSKLFEAADLLDADLVWSSDLNAIRYHLAGMLRAIEECRDPSAYASDLANALLDEFHNEIAIG